MSRRLLIFSIAAAVLITDQVSKALVSAYLPLNEGWNPIAELRPFVSLTYIHNSGAAFGLLPNGNFLFTIIAMVVSGIIIFSSNRLLPEDGVLVRVSLGLQLGGALGNLIDRLRFGYVIDFIDFKFWPIFNVADSCISIGVAILAFYLLFVRPDERPTPDIPSPGRQLG